MPPGSSASSSQPNRCRTNGIVIDPTSPAARDGLYFAYGSNLDAEDLERWCREHDQSSGFLEPITSGYLIDHYLDFSHYSRRRGAGALNVRPHRGAVVPGMMFRVNGENGWRSLDAKEGRGTHYDAIAATACDLDGQLIPVVTYRVPVTRLTASRITVSGNTVDGPIHHPTSPEYADAVRRGSQRFDLPIHYLEAAIDQQTDQHLVSSLFIYGTLMSGECRESFLPEPHVRSRTNASLPGELRDTGSGYPAFFLARKGLRRSSVGREIHCREIAHLLESLDQIEGFLSYQSPHCLYHRRLVSSPSVGHHAPMWTYTYASDGQQMRNITSGCWRTYRQKMA